MRISKVCALINLAGNEEKLMPLTAQRPIAALTFDARYRIIDFMLSSISHANLETVAIFIEESGRSIYDHIRSGRYWDLDGSLYGGIFTYSQQRRKLADYLANKHVEPFYENQRMFINRAYVDYVVVFEGDVIHTIDFMEVLKWHEKNESKVTAVYKKLTPEEAYNNGLETVFMIDDDQTLISTNELEKVNADYVNADCGLYVINKDTLYEMFEKAEKEGFFVNIGELIRENFNNYPVKVHEYDDYLVRINTILTYYNANLSMLNLDTFDELHNGANPIVTRSKSGAPTYYGKQAITKNSHIATGCVIEGTVTNSIISRKSFINKSATVNNALIGAGVTINEGASVEYAILDKGVVVDKNVSVKGQPDNPLVIGKNIHVTKETVL